MAIVYVEHPRNHLQTIACNMPGWLESMNGPSGIYHTFETEKDAVEFVWKIRNHSARYVEINKSMVSTLEQFVNAKGFNTINGLVSKITG